MKKLVRDKIIDIIKAEGNSPLYKILSQKDYIEALKKKLQEEALEAHNSTDKQSLLEELADVQEVIDCLIKAHKLTNKDLKLAQKQKNKKRGSFLKKHFLIKIDSN